MKNTNKKGFTIVELVIVIAVIAILAAVLIPTFASIIKKANLSADQQAIRNINTQLAIGGELKTAGDAINLLRTVNIYGEKLQPFSKGHHYVYSATDNCFALVNEGGAIVYPEGINGSELWAIYTGDYGADRVEGVTRYVAVGTVTNGAALYEYGAITLDLAGNVCTASKNVTVNDETVQIQATLLAGSGYATDAGLAGEGVEVIEDAKEKYNLSTTANLVFGTYEGAIFDGASFSATGDYTFTDCIFTERVDIKASANVTFENCKFIGTEGYAIGTDGQKSAVHRTVGDISVLNCEFINCGRGIQLMAAGNVRVEGCTFNMGTTQENNHALRFNAENAYESVIVKNNKFNSVYAVVRVSHDNGENYNTYTPAVPTVITFSNNTFGKIGCDTKAFAEAGVRNAVSALVDWYNANIK